MPTRRRTPISRARVTKRVNENLAKKVADELLISFKELPGFDRAQINKINKIYDLDGKSLAYYEITFKSPRGKDNGFAIVSATEDDLPVVEFSETGEGYYKQFKKKLPRKAFKMIRFGHAYITAESSRGKLLAEIGERPSVMPPEAQVHIRGEGSDHRSATRSRLKGRVDLSRIRRRPGAQDYRKIKAIFQRRKLPASILRHHWAIAKSPHSPCNYNYQWADGYNSHTYFTQIPKNTSPNNNDHASGCGPTSWINIYGWHDLNWRQTLLNGSQTTNNTYVKNMTMDLHDTLGTYEPWWTFDSDQGFTWPEDMEKGIEYPRGNLQHSCSYWYRHDWWNTDEQWVFEVARDAARKKRPFIVGYYEDWHYAIGYGIAECAKHGWRDHSWIKIYPAWSTNDSQNKWIPMSTIFGVYAAYDYYQLARGSVGQELKRYDWSSGWATAEFYQIGSSTYLFLLKQSGGAVHIHKMKSNGTVGSEVKRYDWSSGWTQAQPFKVGNKSYLFLLKKGNGHVHIHKLNSNGKVGAEVKRYDWSSGWTTAEFYQIGGSTYLFLLKQSGGAVHIHKMKSNGTVGAKVADYDWSSGWTQAKPFKVGNNSYLFLLKKGNGHVHIHKLNTNGTVGAEVKRYDWSSGWTTVEFYQIGSSTYLFLLKQSGGAVHVHKMRSNGKVGAQIDERDWSSGWTQAQPFKVGNKPFLFLLKKGNGHVHIHKFIE